MSLFFTSRLEQKVGVINLDIVGKNILVTGVTGTLGGKVATRFVREGADVRALIRNRSYFDKYQDLGITPIIGEMNDSEILFDALKDVDIVVNCAAYLGDELEEAVKSNVSGVDNIAKISLAVGVKKFIHISTLSVLGEPTEGYFDETTPIIQQHQEVYVDTKSKSEQILNSYIIKGLDVIILRPGAICAEENSYWGDRQINRMLKTEIIDWVHPEDIVPWIHVDNLVEMIHLVLSKGVSNQIYNAIDGNFSEEKFRIRLITALGKELKVPNRLKERSIYSNTKIKELGYRPIKTFEQTVSNLVSLAVSQL